MHVVMEDVLPSRPAIGLSDIQAEQIQFFAQQTSNSMDSKGPVKRERPEITLNQHQACWSRSPGVGFILLSPPEIGSHFRKK